MPETVIYRGPSGTTVDVTSLEVALEAQGMVLKVERDMTHGSIRLDGGGSWDVRKLTHPDDDPCRAEDRTASDNASSPLASRPGR